MYVREPIEMSLIDSEVLLSGELTIEGRIVDASNATLFGKVRSNISEELTVVYKPIAGERPLWDFPEGSLAGREVAAFELSQHLGFNCVPTTVMRDGPYGFGAVQQWIEISEEIDFISMAQQESQAMRNMALFDVIINNTDRKFGHILFTKNGEVYGCDHGVTFHEEFKLRTVLWQFAGSALTATELETLRKITGWLESSDSAVFRKYISLMEISALLTRCEDLIKEGFPYPSQEWPAIPWPPV
jgi:hypothetical protein